MLQKKTLHILFVFSIIVYVVQSKQGRRQQRWVDVDEEDASRRSINRQETHNGGVLPENPTNLNQFTNFVRGLDNGINEQYQSINDISNLQSVENDRSPVETPIEAPVPVKAPAPVEEPAPVFNGGAFESTREGGPLIGPAPQPIIENFLGGTGDVRGGIKPPVMDNDIAGLLGGVVGSGKNNAACTPPSICDGGPILNDFPPPPHIETPVSEETRVSTADHAFYTPHDENQIMVPQGNIFPPGPPLQRVEPPIHKMDPSPSEHKFVPGKTVFLRPFHIFRKRPHRLFHHINLYHHHRPRIFIVRHHRRPEISKWKDWNNVVIMNTIFVLDAKFFFN